MTTISKDKAMSQIKDTKTVSDKIRSLNKMGFTRVQIADMLRKRYQHVRNVLVDDERLGH